MRARVRVRATGGGRGVLIVSYMTIVCRTIDPSTLTMPGRSTPCFHRPADLAYTQRGAGLMYIYIYTFIMLSTAVTFSLHLQLALEDADRTLRELGRTQDVRIFQLTRGVQPQSEVERLLPNRRDVSARRVQHLQESHLSPG